MVANWVIHHGNCIEVMKTLPDASIDAVITDPPYPEVDRDYGRWTEAEWWELMKGVVAETRRVLKPSGSAVFILQPNSEKVGRMRPWLFEFQAWICREWNMVQDAYWWNFAAPPTVHTHRERGLMRPSLKACVWAGSPDCFRQQDSVLLKIAEATLSDKRIDRHDLQKQPSGYTTRHGRALATCRERGGSVPFNVIVMANSDSFNSAGALGHGAGSPHDLCSWWVRYITLEGGIVLDPFCGSATVGLAATRLGREFIGIERIEKYVLTGRERIRGDAPLFYGT